MITVYMVRGHARELQLCPEEDSSVLELLPRGVALKVSITGVGKQKARSVQFHRKYMALLKVAYDGAGMSMPFEAYRRWLAIRAGYFDIAPDGQLIAKSISFANMSPEQFEALYKATLNYLIEHVMGEGTNHGDINSQVDYLLGFAA